MAWWGKVIGGAFGFMLGGPLGAMLGAVVGHNLDKGIDGLPDDPELFEGDRERVQMAFFTATFSVMGHVAKADGHVSEDEIAMARAVMDQMDLDDAMRHAAIDLFGQGKGTNFPLDDVLAQFRRECHGRTTLIQMFMEIQIQAAWADGVLDPAEDQLLLFICRALGLSEWQYRQLEQRIGAQHQSGGAASARSNGLSVAEAYQVLGVAQDASSKDVKRAYRRLMSQHHPDKLVSKGLPEEMMQMATKKTQEIRQAYDLIKKLN